MQVHVLLKQRCWAPEGDPDDWVGGRWERVYSVAAVWFRNRQTAVSDQTETAVWSENGLVSALSESVWSEFERLSRISDRSQTGLNQPNRPNSEGGMASNVRALELI